MTNNDHLPLPDTQLDPLLDLPTEMFRSGDVVEETTVRMQHRKPGFAFPDILNVDVHFTDVNNVALFEGDISLGDADAVRDAPDSRGIGITGEEFRWKDGIVPYVTQEAVRARVEGAIAHWQAKTPIRFKLREDEDDYVSFEVRDGCWSRVGRQGGMQVISLAAGCSVGSAIHEIGHTIGLWHEQSRSDRDDFIEIAWSKIDARAVHNFDKHIQDGEDLGAYDFDSIMHYPATAFGIGGQVTIRTKHGEPIGQRQGLSEGDIAAVKMLYPDLDWSTAGWST